MRYDKRNEIYYWIKIRNKLMYSTEMKLLMRQHDGGWYFSIYLYLIMLSINTKGRLIQEVGDIEMIYDLTTITQELMFFKIDTIRIAIEMLKELNLIYKDDNDVLCISNFDTLVGQETGWAEQKRKQKERQRLESVEKVHTEVHAIVHDEVHAKVPPESRYQSIEYRDKSKENEDCIDCIEINDRVTLPSESEIRNKIKNLLINEWYIEYTNSHLFTRYLVNGRFIPNGDLDLLHAANSYFDSYIGKYFTYEEMKNHVQYFLFQLRKMPKKDRNKIVNKMGYFTNAIKGNQKQKEWLNSEEYIEMSNVHMTVEKNLKTEALRLFPNNQVQQNIFVDEYYLSELGHEMRRIRRDFEKKTTVR